MALVRNCSILIVFIVCIVLALSFANILRPDGNTSEKQVPALKNIPGPVQGTEKIENLGNISGNVSKSQKEVREIDRSAVSDPALVYQHLQRDDGSDVIAVFNRSVQTCDRILRPLHNSERHGNIWINMNGILQNRDEIHLSSQERSETIYIEFNSGEKNAILQNETMQV